MRLIKRAVMNPTQAMADLVPSAIHPPVTGQAVTRRAFLGESGILAASAAALADGLTPTLMHRTGAATGTAADAGTRTIRTICTRCALGCGVCARVENGVWIGQDAAVDHPFNRGARCARGAALRADSHAEGRLKYPMQRCGGRWRRIDWATALAGISARLLAIRNQCGPDGVYWLGSAGFSNEQAYLFRKLVALWGTNHLDLPGGPPDATAAGCPATWGVGAGTNPGNDLHNARAICVVGGNPACDHPVSMLHILRARDHNRAPLIVIDSRFTRTAAHADHFVQVRPGSGGAFVYGMLWHILGNGWQDGACLARHDQAADQLRAQVERFAPAAVERITGVPEAQVRQIARLMALHRPGTLIRCSGDGEHSSTGNDAHACCLLQLALGNLGKPGGGTHSFRGEDNVQGAADMGLFRHSLPGYHGLEAAAWSHWARVWDLDLAWLESRFRSPGGQDPDHPPGTAMSASGSPFANWLERGHRTVPAPADDPRALFLWGHAPADQTNPALSGALERLALVVVVDACPDIPAAMERRADGLYLLPAATRFETRGSVTASNRSVQWRDQVMAPLFESLPDHVILYRLARRLGLAQALCRHIRVRDEEPVVEDITREFSRGLGNIGYSGISPERLQAHQQNWHRFDFTTLRASGGPTDGDYYGLPWPCWGTPELRHPGTPILYDQSRPVANGGPPLPVSVGFEGPAEDPGVARRPGFGAA